MNLNVDKITCTRVLTIIEVAFISTVRQKLITFLG